MKIDYKFALSASELVAKRKDGKVLLSHKQLPEDGILTIDESDIAVLSEGQILEAFNNYIRDRCLIVFTNNTVRINYDINV